MKETSEHHGQGPEYPGVRKKPLPSVLEMANSNTPISKTLRRKKGKVLLTRTGLGPS